MKGNILCLPKICSITVSYPKTRNLNCCGNPQNSHNLANPGKECGYKSNPEK